MPPKARAVAGRSRRPCATGVIFTRILIANGRDRLSPNFATVNPLRFFGAAKKFKILGGESAGGPHPDSDFADKAQARLRWRRPTKIRRAGKSAVSVWRLTV